MVFYQSSCLEIYYEETYKFVETRWLRFASSQEYRASLAAYLEIIQTHEVRRWLGDYRQARVVRLEDQQWAALTWAPSFFSQAGNIERMAKVNARDIASQISAHNMKRDLNEDKLPFLFQEFDNYDQARAWVLQ
ncbi:hypothetical protein AHMF7605_29045 [Adhaeribacter arboris]|uniref:STAS/SEC14 domain-containing protein n=1 Tax=Adhaeribacter arboris TaxID=2072846 RepID=A0A2T2Y962_9BACT|nr:hypothetical protein [Adhaeribacter arboris]PSR51958.1 hypothetical protein AHMF7605_29045 [Adhaeribacter arboris]